jgi:hypothetical protein
MTQFRTLPVFGADNRAVSEVVRGLMDGKSNNTGTVTLATGGATSTTIYDERIGYDSVILLAPSSIQAAATYYPYGAFQDSTTQTASSTTTAYAMTYNTTDYSEGISVTNSSRIKVDYSGLYNLQFSAQFNNADTQIHDVSVWFRKNGTDLAASNSDFSVPNSHGGTDGRLIAALNYYIALQKNDYIEIMWSTDSTQVSIINIATRSSPTRPSTPSVIATMQYLSPNGYTTNVFEAPYVSSRNVGSAVLSHPANSTSGKTYDYIVVG